MGPSGRAEREVLLVCGAVAGPLFMTTFMIHGATLPDYDPVRHPVSGLELSASGWIQILNFIVAGLLTLAFTVGVRRALRAQNGPRSGLLLIGVWAAHLVVAGIFVTDPAAGYPLGTPPEIPHPTMHGVVHNLAAGLGFAALFAACIVFARWFAARGRRGWALYSAVSGAVFLISVILASYGLPRTEGLGELGGLFQRISGACGFAWLAALAVYQLITLRVSPQPLGPQKVGANANHPRASARSPDQSGDR